MYTGLLPIIVFIAIAIGTSILEMYYQFIQTEGQIFEPWREYWFKWVYRYKYNTDFVLYEAIMAYIAKPIALCPYCNGTWLSIIVYLIAYGFHMDIFLFIGLTWSFIRVFDKYKIF